MAVYQYPPFGTVGGSIRATKFSRYLLDHDWQPIVLTIRDSGNPYVRRDSASLLTEVDPRVTVDRIRAIQPPAFLVRLLRGGSAPTDPRAATGKQSLGPKRLLRAFCRTVQGLLDRHLLTYDPMIAWVPFALWRMRRWMSGRGVDAVFVTAPPRSMVVLAWLARRIYHKPVIWDVRDDWVDTPPFYTKSRIQRAIGRWVERRTVQAVDRVVVVSTRSYEDFVARYGAQRRKIRMIPNGCDLDELQVGASTPRDDRDDGRLRIVHAGTVMPPTRDPRALFDALSHLRRDMPDCYEAIDLLFVGPLPRVSAEHAWRAGLTECVSEVGFLPRDEFWKVTRNADLLLTVGDVGFPSMVPGKIYDYWAARRPQLYIGDPGSAWSLVEDNQLGVCVRNDPERIAEALAELVVRWRSGGLGDLSVDGLARYDRQHLTSQLATELDAIVGIQAEGLET